MNPKGIIVWSMESHHRFSQLDRLFVRFILWLKGMVPYIDKHVWIRHIIPYAIKPFIIPHLTVYNLSSNETTETLRALLCDVDYIRIIPQRNAYIQPYGVIRTVRYDDYMYLATRREVNCNGHVFTFISRSSHWEQ